MNKYELVENRRVLLGQALLQTLGSNLLSESAVGISNATLTSLWASSISTSYRETGQPYPQRVSPARANAVSAIVAVPRWSKIPTLVKWHTRLSDGDFSQIALATELVELSNEIYQLALSCENPSADELKKWVRELAIILIEREQWGNSFNKTLRQYLANERDEPGIVANKIDDLLQPEIYPHLVIFGLSGVRALEDITALTNGKVRILKDEQTSPTFSGWGSTGQPAKDFVDFLCRPEPKFKEYSLYPPISICVEVRVDAVSVEAAAEEGRRVMLRLIDSLSAAHPTVQLRLSDLAGVGTIHMQEFRVHRFSPHHSKILRTLGNSPKSPLKESIRAAALIRRFEDPLTRAAFSWISLETAGLEKDDLKMCGKVLALYSLRQEVIVAYRQIVRGVGEYSAAAGVHRRKKQLLLKRVHRLGKFRPPKEVDRLHLISLTESLLKQAGHEEREAVRFEELFDVAIRTINKLSVCQLGHTFTSKDFGKIVDMNSWQKQLREMHLRGPLQNIADIVPSWSSEPAQRIGEVLRDDAQCRVWLNSTAEYYWKLLDGFYSARNVHLHSGVSDVPGSSSMGFAAGIISDAVIEICLHWQYLNDVESPRDIIRNIALRFDEVAAEPTQLQLDLSTILVPHN